MVLTHCGDEKIGCGGLALILGRRSMRNKAVGQSRIYCRDAMSLSSRQSSASAVVGMSLRLAELGDLIVFFSLALSPARCRHRAFIMAAGVDTFYFVYGRIT